MNDIGSVPRSGIQLICIHNYDALFSDEQSSGGGSNVSHINLIVLLEKSRLLEITKYMPIVIVS